MVTKERKRQIRDAALEAKGGLKQALSEPDIYHLTIIALGKVLGSLVDAIIELAEE